MWTTSEGETLTGFRNSANRKGFSLYGAALPPNESSPNHIRSVGICKSRTSLPLEAWNKQIPYTKTDVVPRGP